MYLVACPHSTSRNASPLSLDCRWPVVPLIREEVITNTQDGVTFDGDGRLEMQPDVDPTSDEAFWRASHSHLISSNKQQLDGLMDAIYSAEVICVPLLPVPSRISFSQTLHVLLPSCSSPPSLPHLVSFPSLHLTPAISPYLHAFLLHAALAPQQPTTSCLALRALTCHLHLMPVWLIQPTRQGWQPLCQSAAQRNLAGGALSCLPTYAHSI